MSVATMEDLEFGAELASFFCLFLASALPLAWPVGQSAQLCRSRYVRILAAKFSLKWH